MNGVYSSHITIKKTPLINLLIPVARYILNKQASKQSAEGQCVCVVGGVAAMKLPVPVLP